MTRPFANARIRLPPLGGRRIQVSSSFSIDDDFGHIGGAFLLLFDEGVVTPSGAISLNLFEMYSLVLSGERFTVPGPLRTKKSPLAQTLSLTTAWGRSLPLAVSVCHLPFSSSYLIVSVWPGISCSWAAARFIVEDVGGAIGAIDRLGHLSREKVRRRFEERFTARRMAQDYLSVYRSLMTVTEPHMRLVADEAPAE